MKSINSFILFSLLFGLGILQSCSSSSDDPLLVVNANIQADATSIKDGQSINFSNLSDLNITNWKWTFEGGTPATSTASNPSVTYGEVGDFDVKLVVRSENDVDSIILNDYVSVDYSLKSLVPIGSTSKVAISQGGNLVDAPSYSFTSWIKAGSGSSDYLRLVSLGKSGVNLYIQANNSGSLRVTCLGKKSFGSNSTTRSYTAGTIPTDEWVHFAFTWDGDTARTYINGELDLAYGTPPSGPTAIVRSTNSIFESVGGSMSETAFWNKTLTLEEVQVTMNSCIDPTNDNLQAYWHFKKTASTETVLADAKITEMEEIAYPGTISNATWSTDQPKECE